MRRNAATASAPGDGLSRRAFVLAGLSAAGGLIVGVARPSAANALGAQPWSSERTHANEINAFVVIESDGSVLIRSPHAEMGQGITTALPMIVAEELECDWTKVKVEYASGTRNLLEKNVYGQMWTVASWGVYASYQMLQQAGASARVRLVAAAARRWGVSEAECVAQHSTVVHTPSRRSVGYGALASDAAKITLESEPAIRLPAQFKLIGKPLARLDTPLKVDGSAKFAIDIRVPGMVYAAVVACPVFGGKLANVDDSQAKGRRGIEAVVRMDDAVAVVGNNFWRANEALKLLRIEWSTGTEAKSDSAQFRQLYREALDGPMTIAQTAGNPDDAMGGAARVVDALYETPLLAHAGMEPLSATVDLKPDRLDVWIGTQGPMLAIKQAAGVSGRAPEPPLAINQEPAIGGLEPEQVFVHNCFLGGGFGRRYMHDEMRQAILIAKAVRKPVKVVWTREEDMRQGRYRPQAATRLRAGFDGDGNLTGCEIKTATASILRAIGMDKVEKGVDLLAVMGFNPPIYKVPNLRVACALRNTHIPVGVWRSVGLSNNTFALESFIDELAHASGRDPYQFRRAMLDRPEMIALLDKLAEESDWDRPLPSGRGRGMALAYGFNTIIGEVAEIAVNSTGDMRVERVVAVVDPGHLVNPNTAEAQIEGAIIFGLSAALYGEITIKEGRVEQGNFHDYQVVRLQDTPKIDVYFTPSGGRRWGGIGEAGTGPIAPAVANALFAATGRRMRQLPLKAARS
jgi:isoquinoline 1-oxidoreductase subunit beta